jgi:hypothetical protein
MIGIFNKRFNLFCGILPKIPIWNFVQIRGTARKIVGLVSFKLAANKSKDSANEMVAPEYKPPISTKAFFLQYATMVNKRRIVLYRSGLLKR